MRECSTCDGTGVIDSGGTLPWGEPAMQECSECRHHRWNWKINWCSKNGLPPAREWAWNKAEDEYVLKELT